MIGNQYPITDVCVTCRDLEESGTMVDPGQLESLADALSSLEFFLEGLLSDSANEDILKLAKHSLAALSV